jgi:glycosyltransferase involved in cell wall biosynthesis
LTHSSETEHPLRIAIDAQEAAENSAGGVKSIIIGLISELGKLEDGKEEYTIIGPFENHEWLVPYLGYNQHVVKGPNPIKERPFENIPIWSRPLARRVHKWLYDFINPPISNDFIPISDGFYETLGCDMVHFPSQNFTLCSLPMVYNPHDLQHLHYPQFFSPSQIQKREVIYQAGCHYARIVVAGSQWVKDDLVKQYQINSEKIQVIPWGPPTVVVEEPTLEILETVIKKYDLPPSFAFYPAMIWPHKNHLKLLDSIAYLRDQKNIVIHIVCTGNLENIFWPKIEEHVNNLGLNEQVKFLGTVPFVELRAIYRLCQFLVIPTLFEAASGPIFEAWHDNVPVACSTVTSLPEQVRDAALLFDPFSVESIADSIQRLSTDKHLRDDLVQKGKKRLTDFSWERTAKAYRAIYRKVAHHSLSDEDRFLLNWDWMRNPTNKSEDS